MWRKIATAPKDETEIVVARPSGTTWVVALACRWWDSQWEWTHWAPRPDAEPFAGLPVEQMRRDALEVLNDRYWRKEPVPMAMELAHHLLACLDALGVPGCKPNDLPKEDR